MYTGVLDTPLRTSLSLTQLERHAHECRGFNPTSRLPNQQIHTQSQQQKH